MLAGIRKRLGRKHIDIKDLEDEEKDELQDISPPPSYIKISQGKIQLVHQPKTLDNASNPKDKELLECRIVELEEALLRLQEKVNNSQCGSPTFEKELREQLDNMNRAMKNKERKTMQTSRDHKVLQTRFARQEARLEAMKQSNKALVDRIRQYERCLDDVMRKIVDAIVVEDNLREEVSLLKNRVRDLEAQNAALSASPAKGRDEGYCTMSSGQPQPSNGHLEDLPEEPEHWILPAEPCSTEMEDWSMSQEELAVVTLDDDLERTHQQRHQISRHHHGGPQPKLELGEHDWIWNSNDFLNSTLVETESDGISQLLQQKIVYSEDEDVACVQFTNDFYKLVNIRSAGSTRSIYSYIEGETDDEDDEDSSSSESRNRLSKSRTMTAAGDDNDIPPSPTPSEAGRAQVTSCSSSESDELSRCTTTHLQLSETSETTTTDGNRNEPEQRFDANGERVVEKTTTTTHVERHQLIKSKSIIEEDEPSCILRNNQRREIESAVVRSGSINGYIGSAINKPTQSTEEGNISHRPPVTPWRRSNGWKRLPATSVNCPKKNTKFEILKNSPHAPPTRIPTSIPQLQLSPPSLQFPSSSTHLQQQQQSSSGRKSKIPPPVPIRRSYAS